MYSSVIRHALLLTSLSTFATLGGGAITKKLVGSNAAVSFLILGAIVSGLICLVTLVLKRSAVHSMVSEFLSVAVDCASLAWILLCLALPLLWLYGVFSLIGAALIGFFSFTWFYSLWRGRLHFRAQWETFGEDALNSSFNSDLGTLNRVLLAKKLRLEPDLFLPKSLEKFKWIIAPGLILSMIVGLNLRKTFPGFSAFAWGIPALTIASIVFQISFLFILQALKVAELEKKIGKKIRPMTEEEEISHRRSKRKSKRRFS
jgi:hypothetical protein